MYTGVERNRVVKKLSKTRGSLLNAFHALKYTDKYSPVFDSFKMIQLQKPQSFRGILQFSYLATYVASKLFFCKSYDRF